MRFVEIVGDAESTVGSLVSEAVILLGNKNLVVGVDTASAQDDITDLNGANGINSTIHGISSMKLFIFLIKSVD